MNRRLLLISAALLVTRSGRSDAIIVECANCSSLVEQLISDAKQAAQYATQLQQKATQLQQYANMVQNTVALPQMIWSQAQADIGTVRGLVNAASVLTGNSGTIMSRLSSAQGYATTAAMTPQQITNQFNQWQQTISNASNSFGRTVGLQAVADEQLCRHAGRDQPARSDRDGSGASPPGRCRDVVAVRNATEPDAGDFDGRRDGTDNPRHGSRRPAGDGGCAIPAVHLRSIAVADWRPEVLK